VENERPTMEQLVTWLRNEYNLKGDTPRGYIRIVKRCLGFLEQTNGNLKTTSAGQDFLTTKDNKLVLDIFQERVLGFKEIFSMLAGGQKLSLEEIRKGILEKCDVDWGSPNQTLWRLNWLISLGYVDKEHGKYYLTEKPSRPTPTPPSTPMDDYIKHAEGLIEKHPTMSEANTISTLIEPLIEVLGWDVRDPDEVQREYPIRMGEKTEYVDIALKVNKRPVVFIEAKSVDTPLRNHLAEQPIKYANAEGVSWCMLMNGHELRLYNAFWKIKGIERKMLFKLSRGEFKERINKLMLLSKENVVARKLDDEGKFEHAKKDNIGVAKAKREYYSQRYNGARSQP